MVCIDMESVHGDIINGTTSVGELTTVTLALHFLLSKMNTQVPETKCDVLRKTNVF